MSDIAVVPDFLTHYGSHIPTVESVIHNSEPLLEAVKNYIDVLVDAHVYLDDTTKKYLSGEIDISKMVESMDIPGPVSRSAQIRNLRLTENLDFSRLYKNEGLVLAESGYVPSDGHAYDGSTPSGSNLKLVLELVGSITPRIAFHWDELIEFCRGITRVSTVMQRDTFDRGFPIQIRNIKYLPRYGGHIEGSDFLVTFAESDEKYGLAQPLNIMASDLDESTVIVKDVNGIIRAWMPSYIEVLYKPTTTIEIAVLKSALEPEGIVNRNL